MVWQETDIMGGDYGERETEALQTDILRFLSIIGFCLMAIFALVQAIPVTGPKQETILEDINHDQKVQAEELAYLRAENRRLNREVRRLMQYEGIAGSRQEELDRAKRKLTRQKGLIDSLIGQKISKMEGLIEYKRLLLKREKEISSLKEAKKQMELFIRETGRKVGDIKREMMTAVPARARPAGRKGLYVAFESDHVFLDLLRTDRISLFINISGMKPGFRVIIKEEGIDFVPGPHEAGLDLWEVKENMVPPEIIDAFRSWTTLFSREKILTVGLTPEISRQIRVRKVSTGRFIIKGGGAVSYSPES